MFYTILFHHTHILSHTCTDAHTQTLSHTRTDAHVYGFIYQFQKKLFYFSSSTTIINRIFQYSFDLSLKTLKEVKSRTGRRQSNKFIMEPLSHLSVKMVFRISWRIFEKEIPYINSLNQELHLVV